MKMKLKDVVMRFFSFNLANFDIWIHVWNKKDDIANGVSADEFSHTKGYVPGRYAELQCHQAEINAEMGTLTFFCSENDEDW